MPTTTFTDACRSADRSAATTGRRYGVVRYHRHDGQSTYTVWPLHTDRTVPVTKRGQLGFWAYITTNEED